MGNRSIAIITARGGSKRIPKKNIKEFCGKPIIAYSIEAALNSGAFDDVMVSTDSEEIAEIARKYGASVPFMRSEATSNDFATTRDVLLEVLNRYRENGKEFDYMACIYPTAPFITAKRLKECGNIIKADDTYCIIPVVKFNYPPQRAYIITDKGMEFKWPEYKFSRSQDLEPFYHDAGQFYFYDVKKYIELNGTITTNIKPYILSETEVQDIDNLEDWIIAEQKYRFMKERNI